MAFFLFSRSHLLLLLLFLFITSSLILFRDVEGETKEVQDEQHEPVLVERAIGITGLTTRWDAIRTWAKLAWLNLMPPDSGRSISGGGASTSDVMKEAATRSFETSKEAMEQAASSAATLAGEAVEKTKEKVKSTVSMPRDGQGDPDAEL
ncbi:hypothetical protein J5N97_006938 [Dioscorea zingiberensis]|uniref:Uncharacterized protein n=1 Tax=Dioscorea zingiberensis TaxID=325984 RepID=A0A9D5DEC9_9LILI|nr:hypothetical protein J5N97_006938 [Dioscorea zingiberensis]